MADQDKHSKTEEPTGKRLHDAKEKGNFPRSREVASLVVIIVAAGVLFVTGGSIVLVIKESTKAVFASISTHDVTTTGVHVMMIKFATSIGLALAPFLIIMVGIGIAVNLSQGGSTISWNKIGFDFERLSPLKGFQRLFNTESVFEAFKSILKIALVGYVAFRALRNEIPNAINLMGDFSEITDFITHISFKVVLSICEVMIVLVAIDIGMVRWRFMQNLMMTKNEVRDEQKESEGDAQIKGRMKQMHLERARRRLMQIIPDADVIITNPTHYAVAIKYEREKMWAPIVIAKGADFLALKIKEIGRESRITLVENRFLARELYSRVKEGEEIPEALYSAVAEVLAYVYGLKGKG